MALVKFLGKKLGRIYSGSDGENHIQAVAGSVIEVSEDKLKQLLADFPEDFEESKPAAPPEPAAPPQEPPKEKPSKKSKG